MFPYWLAVYCLSEKTRAISEYYARNGLTAVRLRCAGGAGQPWPDNPDQGLKLPIAALLQLHEPYPGLGERLNYARMSTAIDESAASHVLLRSREQDDTVILLPFLTAEPALQRFSWNLADLPEDIEVITDNAGNLVPHASGPARADGIGIEVEIPDLIGQKTRFRLVRP